MKQRQREALQKQHAQKIAQQSSSKLADDELTRKRKIWKAKWDAQQRAKKQKLALAQKNKQVIQHIKQPQQTNVPKKDNNEFTAAELALASKHINQPSKTNQIAPKPLTREQYHWRWKQQQLKKQQLANVGKAKTHTTMQILK